MNIMELEVTGRKHFQSFSCLLENVNKNHLERIKQSSKRDGLSPWTDILVRVELKLRHESSESSDFGFFVGQS